MSAQLSAPLAQCIAAAVTRRETVLTRLSTGDITVGEIFEEVTHDPLLGLCWVRALTDASPLGKVSGRRMLAFYEIDSRTPLDALTATQRARIVDEVDEGKMKWR